MPEPVAWRRWSRGARLVAVHNKDLIVGEEHVLRGPGQHAAAHIQALERQHHLARVVRLRRRSRSRAGLRQDLGIRDSQTPSCGSWQEQCNTCDSVG